MSFKNKKIFSLVLCFVYTISMLLLTSSYTVFAEEKGRKERGIKEITVLHTNDIHGRVLEEDHNGMGFAKMNTKIKEIQKKNPNTILIDGGDAIQGSQIASISKGEDIIRLMNLMKYDVMAVGNHEFDYGYERLLELKAMADFPMLSGNFSNKYGKNDFKPYIIKEVNGIKIGIFAVITPDTEYATKPTNVEGINFLNPVIASLGMVKELKEKDVDMIIALTHIGINKKGKYSSIDIAENVKGIDIIIDAHSHDAIDKGMKVDNTLIVQSGKYTENLGIINIKLFNNKIISKKAKLFNKKEGKELEEDKEIKDLINSIIEENKNILKETNINQENKIHIVKSGEVLFRIGERYGVDWLELAMYNKMEYPSKIHPGDKIKIPRD